MKSSSARRARTILKKAVSRIKPSVERAIEEDPSWAKRMQLAHFAMIQAESEEKPESIQLELKNQFHACLREKGLL